MPKPSTKRPRGAVTVPMDRAIVWRLSSDCLATGGDISATAENMKLAKAFAAKCLRRIVDASKTMLDAIRTHRDNA
jgi:hypothetical protein